jgi:hypothetical protein
MGGRRSAVESTTKPFFGGAFPEHRTDWGEAFARAIGAALDERDPRGVTTIVETTRGGALVLRISGPDRADAIRIDCWEDEARITAGGQTSNFTLGVGPQPVSWIPEAVEFVMDRIDEWSVD